MNIYMVQKLTDPSIYKFVLVGSCRLSILALKVASPAVEPPPTEPQEISPCSSQEGVEEPEGAKLAWA